MPLFLFTELKGRIRICSHCAREENSEINDDAEDDEGDDESDDEGDDKPPESSSTSGQHSGGSFKQQVPTSSSGLPSGSGQPGGSTSAVSLSPADMTSALVCDLPKIEFVHVDNQSFSFSLSLSLSLSLRIRLRKVDAKCVLRKNSSA